MLRVAAMLATLAIGAALGWYSRGELNTYEQPVARMINQAFTAHVVYSPEIRHPVEVDASEEKHLVTWLAKRLKAPIHAPNLHTLGFELLGGRLLAAEGKPAAQFMYQDNAGNRLTLFIRKNPDARHDTAFRFARQENINAFYWIDDGLGYALIGELDKPTISKAAHLVYKQLTRF